MISVPNLDGCRPDHIRDLSVTLLSLIKNEGV